MHWLGAVSRTSLFVLKGIVWKFLHKLAEFEESMVINMKYYEMYGLTLESDIDLLGAYEIEKVSEPDVVIRQEKIEDKYITFTPVEYDMEIGAGMVSYNKDWTCARFKGLATFMITNGNHIAYHLYEGYNKVHVNELIIDYSLCVLAYQRERLMIHGSGIYYKGKSLIISGESGAGKSSLADEMLSRGNLMTADDVVALDQEGDSLYVYSSYPKRKLCADVVERKGLDKSKLILVPNDQREKYNIILDKEYYPDKLDIGALVIIQKGDVNEPVIQEITGSDKLKYLTKSYINKEIFERISFTPDLFMKSVKIANLMKIYLLTRPESGDTVKQQADLVEEKLNNMYYRQ